MDTEHQDQEYEGTNSFSRPDGSNVWNKSGNVKCSSASYWVYC